MRTVEYDKYHLKVGKLTIFKLYDEHMFYNKTKGTRDIFLQYVKQMNETINDEKYLKQLNRVVDESSRYCRKCFIVPTSEEGQKSFIMTFDHIPDYWNSIMS